MKSRPALLVAALLGTVSVAWGVAQIVRQRTEPGKGGPDAAVDRATLRFFRDPAAAPALDARDLDGRQISLAALRGKVVIVNFWATWCPPCRAEIPDLIALQEKYGDRLQIIGISQDEASAEFVRTFASEHHMNYPIVMSTPAIEKVFPGIAALPTSFVIDPQSRVVQKHVGMLSAALTEQETRALAGLPVNATIEQVDRSEGLKLVNGAQALTIPGIDLSSFSPEKRTEALQKLNAQSCTCGCDLTIARCRVDDPDCGISLPIARQIVQQLAAAR